MGHFTTIERGPGRIIDEKPFPSLNVRMHKCLFFPCRFVLRRTCRQYACTIESFKVVSHTEYECNILRLAVCDIGSASFKYDMRRLSEILAFPRAWYRRSIARRLFLGDQTINLPGDFLISLWFWSVFRSDC